MVDNKDAESLKETKNVKFKIYYCGDTPAIAGVETMSMRLPADTHVWLVKEVIIEREGGERRFDGVRQFVDCDDAFFKISRGLDQIIDATIVNNKQRDAVRGLIIDLLVKEFQVDKAPQNDFLCS